MKRGESGFQKTIKKCWLRKFSVWVILDTYLKGRAPASELVLLRGGKVQTTHPLPGPGTPGCKRNIRSMEKIRILLRPVALVLLFITFYYYDPDSSFGSESTIVQTAV